MNILHRFDQEVINQEEKGIFKKILLILKRNRQPLQTTIQMKFSKNSKCSITTNSTPNLQHNFIITNTDSKVSVITTSPKLPVVRYFLKFLKYLYYRINHL